MIQAVCTQASQASFDRADDVFAAEIDLDGIAGFPAIREALAAFGLDNDLIAETGGLFGHLAEDRFGFAESVEVGVVEECDAAFVSGVDEA